MPTVSEFFRIPRGQEALEFVDVDVQHDQEIFLDPAAIRFAQSDLSQRCVSLLQSFFESVLRHVRLGRRQEGVALLSSLSETSETRMGYASSGRRGHGMGTGIADELWDRLSQSRAATTGSLQDLEEATLFIRKIGEDVTSDLITNICRRPLASFTASMCTKYGIPTRAVSITHWSRSSEAWEQDQVDLPVVDGEPLLLVPKTFVRVRNVFDAERFYRHYSLPILQDRYLARGELIRTLKSGAKRPPYKKTLEEIYPDRKGTNDRVAVEEVGVVDEFRRDVETSYRLIGHESLRKQLGKGPVDWQVLLEAVVTVAPGKAGANDYHLAVENLLNALLYPYLTDPVHEFPLYDGRKRIDIDYKNSARDGFFHWLHAVHKTPCSYVPVECKNYGESLKNPEIDQLLGRFGVNRGSFGILCHRGFGDPDLLFRRCKDAALNKYEYVITLDDADLGRMVEAAISDGRTDDLLQQKFRALVS